jgi:hypothetical protein
VALLWFVPDRRIERVVLRDESVQRSSEARSR